MKIQLYTAIMGIHERRDSIQRLIGLLGRPEVAVFLDRFGLSQGGSPLLTALRCWRSIPEWATHALVLQDDVRVCRDFCAGVEAVLEVRPAQPVAFYANHKAIDVARAEGKRWAKIPLSHSLGGVWGQAQCLPRELVLEFLSWYEALPRNLKRGKPTRPDGTRNEWLFHDDWVLGQFLKSKGIAVWATVPSLVEHDSPTSSSIGYSNKTKVARCYIGDRVSALSVDWAAGSGEQDE